LSLRRRFRLLVRNKSFKKKIPRRPGKELKHLFNASIREEGLRASKFLRLEKFIVVN